MDETMSPKRESGYTPPRRMIEEVYGKIVESLSSGQDVVHVLEQHMTLLLSEVSLHTSLNDKVKKMWKEVLVKLWDARFPEIPCNETLLNDTDPQYLPYAIYEYVSGNREFLIRLTKRSFGLKSDVDHAIKARILLYLFTAVTHILRSLGYRV